MRRVIRPAAIAAALAAPLLAGCAPMLEAERVCTGPHPSKTRELAPMADCRFDQTGAREVNA
jgi:hypothetical protein